MQTPPQLPPRHLVWKTSVRRADTDAEHIRIVKPVEDNRQQTFATLTRECGSERQKEPNKQSSAQTGPPVMVATGPGGQTC